MDSVIVFAFTMLIIWAVWSPVSFAKALRDFADEIHNPNEEHRD